MKKAIIILCLIAIIVTPAFAKKKGHLSVTAKASIYNPPGDDLLAPMFTVEARYRMSAFIAIVGSASWTKYEISDIDYTFVPVAVDGELHPLGNQTFDPYAGAGLALNFRQPESGDPDINIGAEILGGVTYKPKNNFGVEFDVKYRIEDLANPGDSGSWSVGGGVTGSW